MPIPKYEKISLYHTGFILPWRNRIPGLFQDLIRFFTDLTHTFISQKQFETTFSVSFKIGNKIGQVDLFQLVPKRSTYLLDSSKYHFCNLFSHYLKFQDFQALLPKFRDIPGLDFYFSNSRTFQAFQDQCEPWSQMQFLWLICHHVSIAK